MESKRGRDDLKNSILGQHKGMDRSESRDIDGMTENREAWTAANVSTRDAR